MAGKFVGQPAPRKAQRIEQNNATFPNGEMVRLTYNQMRLMPPDCVHYSLDTTARGARGCRAKRWYRWFAYPEAVLANELSTPLMRVTAQHMREHRDRIQRSQAKATPLALTTETEGDNVSTPKHRIHESHHPRLPSRRRR